MSQVQETQTQTPVQIGPDCIHSALKHFLQPLKTNDPRADFFSLYRRESDGSDKEKIKKYDEDLNTSLIFAGLFSAVSSAFIIDIQPKLEPDPNQLTAVYMQVLLHTLNASLYPDVAPPLTTWPGPDGSTVVVQCLLYASLATSLFVAFVSMLGKQWLNRFGRHKGSTAAEKSWDRQNKLQGMENWRFYIVMESLPIMLQLALLLLGCALSSYLWSLNRVAATIALSVTSFGVIFYAFITIAGSIFYKCPYQTPMSLMFRTAISRLQPHIPRIISPFISGFFTQLDKILRSAKSTIRQIPAFALRVTHEPFVMDRVSVNPAPLFGGKSIDWFQHQEDSKCVVWTMDVSGDPDVLLCSVRFAADIMWYPEIATSISLSGLSGIFHNCFLDGKIIPGAEERACYIARTLASVLNIHACIGYNLEAASDVGEKIYALGWEHKDPDVAMAWWFLTLTFHEEILVCPPLRKDTSPSFYIWLSKMILQSVYWRQAKAENQRCNMVWFAQPFGQILAGRKVPNAVHLNLILACAVSLGLRLDLSDLHTSDNSPLALHTALKKLNEWMVTAIPDLSYGEEHIRVILRFLRLWGDPGFQDLAGYCMSWVETTLNSGRPELHQHRIARNALLALDDYPGFSWFDEPTPLADDTHAGVALRYLVLYRCVKDLDQSDLSPGLAAAVVAFQIIRMECSDVKRPEPKTYLLGESLVHALTWAAEKDPNNPLHFRPLALEIFTSVGGMWFDPWVDDISLDDKARFIDALGNVFDVQDPTSDTSHLPTQQLLSLRMGVYGGEAFVGRTAAFVHRSSEVFLVPLPFGLCSSRSWQPHIKKSTFSFVSHPSFDPDKWVVWLRHTLKMIVNDSRLDITLLVEKLKELECYDVLELVIKSIWLSPEPDLFPRRLWPWVEQETIELFKTRNDLGSESLRRYFPLILDTYNEPFPDDTLATPYEAARSVFQHESRPSGAESYGRPSLEVQRPLHWRIHRVCVVKQLFQVLERGWDLEGLEILDLVRIAPGGGELTLLEPEQ